MNHSMRTPQRLAAALFLCASTAFAAPARYLIIDHSSESLIDKAGAIAVWAAQVDDKQRARLQKLYPVSKWGFVSQVEGGFTDDKACVVTARAMMVPRIVGDRLVFKPAKSATTFASQAGATREQCQALAAAKLKEAVDAVASSLIAP
jgi:hypothetical protein